MVFGFQETAEHLLMHMDRLRSLQDETGGFTAFITWPFQADGTRLKLRDGTSAFRYLRVQALAPLYLDNIPNIQVSWVKMGRCGSEQVLRAGANDLGGALMDENISRAAGASHGQGMEEAEFRSLVEPLGRTLEQPWVADRGGLVAGVLIGFEAVLGALLVAGLAPGLAPLGAIAFLTVVTVVEARLWRTGVWSRPCHCGLPWLDLADHPEYHPAKD